jgi:hypothetical protein
MTCIRWVAITPQTQIMHTLGHGYFAVTWDEGVPCGHLIRKSAGIWEYDPRSHIWVSRSIMLKKHQGGDFFHLKGDEFVPLTPLQRRMQSGGPF